MKYRIKRQSSTPFDKVHEECGVFGIAAPEGKEISAAHDAYTALFALQHRGQEAAGIAVNKNGVIHCHKDVGLVSAVFNQDILDNMPGSMAIGHVRYSTTGDTRRENAQPISITHVKGNLAVAHNGNLVNAGELRREIEDYDKERELLQGAEEPDFERLAELKGQNEIAGAMFKMKEDPRVTKIGKFIRKHSIDEFPQFLNVFLGQMSVVGPRPPLPNEVAEYTEYDLQRLAVKPGITGWWQVTDRNDTDFDGMVRRDLEYIAKRGPITDLKIVLLTVIEVFTGGGAC